MNAVPRFIEIRPLNRDIVLAGVCVNRQTPDGQRTDGRPKNTMPAVGEDIDKQMT